VLGFLRALILTTLLVGKSHRWENGYMVGKLLGQW
jgi:hypothetical protein